MAQGSADIALSLLYRRSLTLVILEPSTPASAVSRSRYRPERDATESTPIDLFDYVAKDRPSEGASSDRPKRRDWRPRIVTDMPDRIPVTPAELDVFETHLADFLDRLFGGEA